MELLAGLGKDRQPDRPAILPDQIQVETTSGAQAGERAVFPGRGKRGQQPDNVIRPLALEQHLGDAGCPGPVAVEEHRRLGMHQITKGVVFEQVENRLAGVSPSRNRA
jgi:hypothetical protein